MNLASTKFDMSVQICGMENEIWDFWVFDDRILEWTIHFTQIHFTQVSNNCFKKQNPNQSTMTNWRNEAGFGFLLLYCMSSITLSGNLHSSWEPRPRALRMTEILYIYVIEQGMLGHADRWTYLSSRVLDEWMEQERKRGRTRWWGAE